jgi:magnesium-transporting ATPase (P-type)
MEGGSGNAFPYIAPRTMMRKQVRGILETIKKEEFRGFNILIGGLFLILPFFQILSLGFLAKKLENLIELNMKPPKWDANWKELLEKGLYALVLIVIYFFLPVILMMLSGFFTTVLSKGQIFSLFFLRGQLISMVMTFIFLIALFLFPFAFAEAVAGKDFRKGLDVKAILAKIFLVPVAYFKTFGVILGIYMFSLVVIFLLFNSIAAYLLSGFILFFDSLFSIHLISKIYPRSEVPVQKVF